jgi:hypothetical protein
VAVPDFTSNTYVPFFGSITGNIGLTANMLAVWSPRETKFMLRGGYVHILCTIAGTGAAGQFGELLFYDEGSPSPVLPITSYAGTQAAGWVNTIAPWHFDLGKGFKSATKNNRLMIGGTLAIGAGTFACFGLVWGIQEL